MSYRIYTTDAFILNTYPSGEGDRTILAYTRELGLVYARAIGVRKIKSKLRFALEPLSFATLSVVRGKQEWRITNAQPKENLYKLVRCDTARLSVLMNATNLLRRLVVGEASDPMVFDNFREGLLCLSDLSFGKEQLSGLELLLVLRLLNDLGYVGQETSLVKELTNMRDVTGPFLARLVEEKKALVRVINHSLKQSHL